MPDTSWIKQDQRPSRVGLILTGGGARAAYQVGVLKAIAELVPEDAPIPFPIICGMSAGAINAATLACGAGNFHQAVADLLSVWDNFQSHKVFRTDARIALISGLNWFFSLLFGEWGKFSPKSLLDNSPLRTLLEERLRLENIKYWIDTDILHAFSVSAAAYGSGQSVTFYQGKPDIKRWKRIRRIGIPRPITLNHLMASIAIPILFPPVRIGYEYYGDGSMRQTAPLSTAIHLGAERLLVIGVRNERPDEPLIQPRPPTLGQVAGFVLDTLFMDNLSIDIERLKRINHTLHYIPPDKGSKTPLREIDLLSLFPSQEIRPIAERHVKEFPRSVLYLLRGIGARNPGGRSLISYLLFERGFCQELIELGYQDAMRIRSRLVNWLPTAQKSLIS